MCFSSCLCDHAEILIDARMSVSRWNIELDKGADTEGDIIGGGEQSFAKMSFIAEVTARLGIEDLLYSNMIAQN